jgi:integrase
MVETKLLTDAAVRNLKPGKKDRLVRDAGAQSLYLVIAPRRDGDKRNAKSWRMRFRDLDGRPAKIVLGPLDLSGHELKATPEIGQPLSLAGARALAADIHRRRARGEDVVGEHKARKIRRRTEVTEQAAANFGACVIEFVRDHRVKRHHVRTRRWYEVARTLGLSWPRHVDPTKHDPEILKGGLAERWATKDVRTIDGGNILVVVDEARKSGIPGLEARNDGTSEARGRRQYSDLSVFFGWLQKTRRIVRNPCLGLHHPGAPAERERVLNDAEIRWLWIALDAEPLYGPLVKLLLLTGQRLNEVAGLRWNELNDDRTTWTIPGTRTKNHRSHIVALSPAAINLLPARGASELVFTTTGTTAPSGWGRLKRRFDRKMAELAGRQIPAWRFHDLRRTFVTGMGELGIRPDVIELAVNHKRAGVLATYNKSTLLPERTEAFARWALHVAGIVEARPANVTQLAHKRVRRGDRR